MMRSKCEYQNHCNLTDFIHAFAYIHNEDVIISKYHASCARNLPLKSSSWPILYEQNDDMINISVNDILI